MDRDTIRLALLVIGVLVIAGIYIAGRIKRGAVEDEDELDEELRDYADAMPTTSMKAVRHAADDDLHLERMGSALQWSAEPAPPQPPSPPQPTPVGGERDYAELARSVRSSSLHAANSVEPTRTMPDSLGLPPILQLCVVAADGDFPGSELLEALEDLGLDYGEMGIFHRHYNGHENSIFSVASLVEPGTFPIDDMDGFVCPGVVLFLLPARVPDPAEAFEDMLNTCRELARRLGGVEWDADRKPLTGERIASLRATLGSG